MGYKILKTATTKLGNNIELISGSNLSKPPALVIGVFHGDEPQGKYLIEKYLEKNYTGKALFIPCLNPDGITKNTRTNANGVDLNRNFPTKNWGQDTSKAGNNPNNYYSGTAPASEIETQFVIDILKQYKPKLIITLHAPYKIVNFDGPAQDVANKISKIIGYPVEPSIGYPTPGSFGTYCGIERNIPTITLELDENSPVNALVNPVFKIFDEVL